MVCRDTMGRWRNLPYTYKSLVTGRIRGRFRCQGSGPNAGGEGHSHSEISGMSWQVLHRILWNIKAVYGLSGRPSLIFRR